MSREDFERCTPSEFNAIHKQWQHRETRLYRDGWEQVRTLAAVILPVYGSKKSARQLIPFPWDNENQKAAVRGGSSYERMKEILARVNGG